MDLSNNNTQAVNAPSPSNSPPPKIEPDMRPVADVASSKSDPTPDIPLPIPASTSQTGLIGAAALKQTDASPRLDASGVSAAERTLKPYGITMLPEKIDYSNQGQ